MNIPEKLINFKCYLDGSNEVIGIVDATIPDIEYMTETLSGAGIAGEIESTTLGHTGVMTITLSFRSLVTKNILMLKQKRYALELKGALQETDPTTGAIIVIPMSASMRVVPKKGILGKLTVAKPLDSSNEFSVDYIKLTISGETVLEIDKLNMIANVGGEDVLTEVRAAIGM